MAFVVFGLSIRIWPAEGLLVLLLSPVSTQGVEPHAVVPFELLNDEESKLSAYEPVTCAEPFARRVRVMSPRVSVRYELAL